MLSNLHTHTTFCDGKSTAEETVISAINKGFSSLGFSAHAYAPYGLEYCMTDEDGYIKEILRLREKYKNKLEIYLGTEEDAFHLIDRSKYDYIIGSIHYLNTGYELLPVDLGVECVDRYLAAFGGDIAAMSENYYSHFKRYLLSRRPDVVGHFDLLTKYDEVRDPVFLGNPDHTKISERFLSELAREGFLFEVNTGAIARGLRTAPYPAVNLLRIIKGNDASVILSSDCHKAEDIDCSFSQTKELLWDVGFRELTVLYNHKFTKIPINI